VQYCQHRKIRAKTDQTIDAISTKTNIGKNPRDPLEALTV
jgi:hypothetical protein